MIQQKMDDMSTSSTNIDGFPIHVEVIDKSMAALKRENKNEYKVLMKFYLAGKSHTEIGMDMGRDPDWVRALHARAIGAIARIKRGVRLRLTAGQ